MLIVRAGVQHPLKAFHLGVFPRGSVVFCCLEYKLRYVKNLELLLKAFSIV